MHAVFGTDYISDVNVALNITYATMNDSLVSPLQGLDGIGNTGKWSSLAKTNGAYFIRFDLLEKGTVKHKRWQKFIKIRKYCILQYTIEIHFCEIKFHLTIELV